MKPRFSPSEITAERVNSAPKLPFRQPPHKRPEFVVSLRGKRGTAVSGAFFDLVCEEVVLKRRIELGL